MEGSGEADIAALVAGYAGKDAVDAEGVGFSAKRLEQRNQKVAVGDACVGSGAVEGGAGVDAGQADVATAAKAAATDEDNGPLVVAVAAVGDLVHHHNGGVVEEGAVAVGDGVEEVCKARDSGKRGSGFCWRGRGRHPKTCRVLVG